MLLCVDALTESFRVKCCGLNLELEPHVVNWLMLYFPPHHCTLSVEDENTAAAALKNDSNSGRGGNRESRIPHEQDSEVKVSWHSRRPTVSHVVTPPFFCHIYCSMRTQTPWHVPVPDGGGLKKLPRHETDKNRCAAEAKMTRCLICKSGGDEALRRSCRLVVKITVHIKKTQKSFWRTTVAVPATKPLIGYNRATEKDQIKN